LRDTKQVRHAGVHLLHTESQGCGHTEKAGDGGQDIDGIAKPAIDALFQNRIKDVTDRQRQPFGKAEKRQPQSDQRVYPPGMKSPVEKGQFHGHLGTLDGAGL